MTAKTWSSIKFLFYGLLALKIILDVVSVTPFYIQIISSSPQTNFEAKFAIYWALYPPASSKQMKQMHMWCWGVGWSLSQHLDTLSLIWFWAYTDKKENKIVLIYKEILSGAVATSCMRKSFLIYEEMRKYFPIYEEAVSHIWLCNCSILKFLIYQESLFFFFLSVYKEAWPPQGNNPGRLYKEPLKDKVGNAGRRDFWIVFYKTFLFYDLIGPPNFTPITVS